MNVFIAGFVVGIFTVYITTITFDWYCRRKQTKGEAMSKYIEVKDD